MGSVLSYIECPNCHNLECAEDYYYKSDELYLFCHSCGYSRDIYIKRDETTHIPILKDPDKSRSFDNYIWIEEINLNPYGVLIVKFNNSGSNLYSLKDEYEFIELFRVITEADTSNISKIELSRLVDNKIISTIIPINDEVQTK